MTIGSESCVEVAPGDARKLLSILAKARIAFLTTTQMPHQRTAQLLAQ